MNRFIKIRYLFIAIILSVGFIAKPQDIPDEYLVEAARNNPGLKSKFNEYLAALEKVPQVGSLPDPQLTFGYFIQPVETRVGPQRARISLSQMFPWFGTLGARKDVATEMAKSKYEIFEEAKSRLYYDVKSTWYNLYFNRKAFDISTENITILKMLRKLALIKVEAGLASSVDVLRAEMEIADLENQLALLKDNYLVMQTEFNKLLNVEKGTAVNIPDSLPGQDFFITRDAVMDSIKNGNHQILQLEFMEASYTKQELAARDAGKPNLMVGLDYVITGKGSGTMATISDAGKDAIVFPMVGISIPLYRQKYTALVRESVLLQESAKSGIEDKINLLETIYEKADRDYRDADRRILLFSGQTDKAGKALGILQTAYETDGKNFEEVMRMERQLLKYKLESEKARADKDAAVAFIHYLMGK
jgi:cobalt-zinc-cadmium efflux system outer membrane protein